METGLIGQKLEILGGGMEQIQEITARDSYLE